MKGILGFWVRCLFLLFVRWMVVFAVVMIEKAKVEMRGSCSKRVWLGENVGGFPKKRLVLM